MYEAVYESPVGRLVIKANGEAVTHVLFGGAAENKPNAVTEQCARELSEYFAGKRKSFSVKLAPEGSPFRKDVWAALCGIPYGETISYAQLAKDIGKPKAVRAVGGANHHNPISIIVPCHRVIGADGSLTGYGGGLEAKKFLLDLERGGDKG